MNSVYVIEEPREINDECLCCGADIDPSSLFVWHYEGDDCRSVRDPLIGPTIFRSYIASHPETGRYTVEMEVE